PNLKLSLIPLLPIFIKNHSKSIHFSIFEIPFIFTLNILNYLHKFSILISHIRYKIGLRISGQKFTNKSRRIIFPNFLPNTLKPSNLFTFSNFVFYLIISLRFLLNIIMYIFSAHGFFRRTLSLFYS